VLRVSGLFSPGWHQPIRTDTVLMRPPESAAPPIADGAVLVSGLEGATVSNLVRKTETRWEADVTPARAGKRLRAVVEVRAYGEPVGRANAETEAR